MQIRLSKCMVMIYAYYSRFSNQGAMIVLVLYYVPWHTIVQIQNKIQVGGSCCQVSSDNLPRLTAVAHHSGQQESWRKPWMGTICWHPFSAGATVFSDYWEFVRNLIRFILSIFSYDQWNLLIHAIMFDTVYATIIYNMCVVASIIDPGLSQNGGPSGETFSWYMFDKKGTLVMYRTTIISIILFMISLAQVESCNQCGWLGALRRGKGRMSSQLDSLPWFARSWKYRL